MPLCALRVDMALMASCSAAVCSAASSAATIRPIALLHRALACESVVK